jgi:hypothetical protein
MKSSLRLNRQPRHQRAKLGLMGKKGGRTQRRAMPKAPFNQYQELINSTQGYK